jgi:hypothetical protein
MRFQRVDDRCVVDQHQRAFVQFRGVQRLHSSRSRHTDHARHLERSRAVLPSRLPPWNEQRPMASKFDVPKLAASLAAVALAALGWWFGTRLQRRDALRPPKPQASRLPPRPRKA